MSDGDEVRLGRDGVVVGWFFTGLVAAVVAGLCTITVVTGTFSLVGALLIPVTVLVTLVLRSTRMGDDELVLSHLAVSARTRGQAHRWLWSEVLEVGMNRLDMTGPYTSPGCTIWIRPEGSTFDVPGPNALFPVTIPVFGLRAHRRVRQAVARACTEHGIPFDTRGLRMGAQPRPGSPLRTMPPRHAPSREDR